MGGVGSLGSCVAKEADAATEAQDASAVAQASDEPPQAVPLWLQQVKEAGAAAPEAEAAPPVAEAAAPAKAKAAAGVWAAGEEADAETNAAATKGNEDAPVDAPSAKEEEAKKKKLADAAKKKKAQDVKKRKDEEAKAAEAATKEAPAAAAAQPAEADKAQETIREREQAWKKKTAKEKEDLAKKIHAAAKEGDAGGVDALLGQGVSANAEDGDGWTPLIAAADAGRQSVVELLLKQRANPKAAVKLGEWGQTALHFAARHGHKEIAELVAPGSNVKGKNFQGKTASEVAKAEGHKEIARLLRAQEKQAA